MAGDLPSWLTPTCDVGVLNTIKRVGLHLYIIHTSSERTFIAGGITIHAQVPSGDGLYTISMANWTKNWGFFLGLTRCEALADRSPDLLAVPGLREAVLSTGTTSVQCSLRPQPVWGQEQLCLDGSSSSAFRLQTEPLPQEKKAMEHTFSSVRMGMNSLGIKSSTNSSREHRIYLN